MAGLSSVDLTDLLIARRLLERMEAASKRGRHETKVKTARDYFEEDQALLSGADPTKEIKNQQVSVKPVQMTDMNLADLSKNIRAQAQMNESVTVTVEQRVEQEFRMEFRSLERVDGLVVRSQNIAETDRYQFEFTDGSTLKIIDKWTNQGTRIWGDPHVDLSDMEGQANGEFSDMKGSSNITTLMLLDGTRVTITAPDNGIIQKVDIYKGGQHLGGTGAGASDWNEKTGLFNEKVDAATGSSQPLGDVAYAGGDGADWFDSAHKLLWGHADSPTVMSRPSATLSLYYRQSISQSVTIEQVSRQS